MQLFAVSGCIIKDTRRIYNRKITKKSKNEKNLSKSLAMPMAGTTFYRVTAR